MKKHTKRKTLLLAVFVAMAMVILCSCNQQDQGGTASPSQQAPISEPEVSAPASSSQAAAATTLYVQFGDNGTPFAMQLYDNETAAAIAYHVGTADWRIPLYNYQGYDNWDIMQYYDIPNRYDIPANPETVTTQPAGTVYYADPNRIVLFYGQGEVSGEYTPVGYFDATPAFVSAVQENPVLEGWGNKIIRISAQNKEES